MPSEWAKAERIKLFGNVESARVQTRAIDEALDAAKAAGFKAAIDQTTPGWRDLCTALRMIEDAVQELEPTGALRTADTQGSPPDPIGDAEAVIAGIQRIEAAAKATGRAEITAMLRAVDIEMVSLISCCRQSALADINSSNVLRTIADEIDRRALPVDDTGAEIANVRVARGVPDHRFNGGSFGGGDQGECSLCGRDASEHDDTGEPVT